MLPGVLPPISIKHLPLIVTRCLWQFLVCPRPGLFIVMFSRAWVVWVMWVLHGEVAPPEPACAEMAHVLHVPKAWSTLLLPI
jgi:hypothetical protein